ncbi:MAG: hypothetical protein R3258_03590 [Acidimicrobiia bacterium]|nr:hypothetical protein [Acidimicrobiia bacterium]
MTTEERMKKLFAQANPVPDPGSIELDPIDGAAYLRELEKRSSIMTQTPITTDDRRISRPRRTAVLATLLTVVVIGGLGLLIARQGDDVAGSSSSTEPDEVSVQIATGFVEAYGSFDAERADSYLAPDADLSGMEGGQQEWQAALRWFNAQGFELMLDSCNVVVTRPTGTRVRCFFDYHGIHSREMGLGPYEGSRIDVVVVDGEIVEAFIDFEYLQNGFSRQVWEPFAQWVVDNHPEDVDVMYTDESLGYQNLTEESITLWAMRTRQYADQAKQN